MTNFFNDFPFDEDVNNFDIICTLYMWPIEYFIFYNVLKIMFPFILSFVSINPRGAILKNINATHALMKTKTENSYLFLNPRISIKRCILVRAIWCL